MSKQIKHNTQVKPCPFCNEPQYIRKKVDGTWWINGAHKGGCLFSKYYYRPCSDNAEELVEAWNRREKDE